MTVQCEESKSQGGEFHHHDDAVTETPIDQVVELLDPSPLELDIPSPPSKKSFLLLQEPKMMQCDDLGDLPFLPDSPLDDDDNNNKDTTHMAHLGPRMSPFRTPPVALRLAPKLKSSFSSCSAEAAAVGGTVMFLHAQVAGNTAVPYLNDDDDDDDRLIGEEQPNPPVSAIPRRPSKVALW